MLVLRPLVGTCLPLLALLACELAARHIQPYWAIITDHPLTLVADHFARLGVVFSLSHVIVMAVPVDGGERRLNLSGVRAQETLPAVLVAIDVREP